MKLLFVIRALCGVAGGAERVLSEVASGLADLGHEVDIASWDARHSEYFYPLDRRIIRYTLGDPSFKGVLALRVLLAERRPDVAVGIMYSAFLPLALAAFGTGTRIVASEHTAFAHYQARPGLRLLLNAAAPRFNAMTVPSERVRDGFPGSIAPRMTVIPNPVTLPKIKARRNRSPRVRTLLAVGNLREEKGHGVLVEAFARVASEHSEWHLRIAGEGPKRTELSQQVERLGLQTRVNLLGVVHDISSEYANADLFVMPSVYESFGLATAEALAAGVPAVGFADCPGTNDLIVDGVNGLLVEGQNRPDALAAGFRQLMSSEELRRKLGRAGPGSVAKYSLAGVTARWDQLVETIVIGGGTSPNRSNCRK